MVEKKTKGGSAPPATQAQPSIIETSNSSAQGLTTQAHSPKETASIGLDIAEDGVVGLAELAAEPLTPKIPKKRGRKPKGGKIVPNNFLLENNKSHEPNIIMHLKCGESDLVQNTFNSSISYDSTVPLVETFQF